MLHGRSKRYYNVDNLFEDPKGIVRAFKLCEEVNSIPSKILEGVDVGLLARYLVT